MPPAVEGLAALEAVEETGVRAHGCDLLSPGNGAAPPECRWRRVARRASSAGLSFYASVDARPLIYGRGVPSRPSGNACSLRRRREPRRSAMPADLAPKTCANAAAGSHLRRRLTVVHRLGWRGAGVTGPNGAGKTTLLRALAGFLPAVQPGRSGSTGAAERDDWPQAPHYRRPPQRHQGRA